MKPHLIAQAQMKRLSLIFLFGSMKSCGVVANHINVELKRAVA
jgi:hypothetical protein